MRVIVSPIDIILGPNLLLRSRRRAARAASGIITLLIMSASLLYSAPALAQSSPELELNFEAAFGEMRIGFSADSKAIPAKNISARRDQAKRLRFTIDGGYQCAPRYIKDWRAPKLKRVYLYPSKKVKGRCYLLIRMSRKIPKRRARAIEINEEAAQSTAVFRWRAPKQPKVVKAAKKSASSSSNAQPKADLTRDQAAPSEPTSAQPLNNAPKQVELLDPSSSKEANAEAQSDAQEREPTQAVAPTPTASEMTPVSEGERATMEAPRDRVLSPDQPAEVIRTVVIGQFNKARTLSAAPVILSTPTEVTGGAPEDQLKLKLSGRLLTQLIDREASLRGGGIWVADPELRAQMSKLNPHSARLSISQEQLVAQHVSAELISRSQLSLNDQEMTLTISMTPVGVNDGAPSDSGVYQVEHKLSRQMIESALDQTWIVEHRSSSIWRSLLLPGWGHLYRGERRQGLTYLSAGLGLVIGAVISSSLGYAATQDYNRDEPSTAHRRDDANAHYDRANLLWMGAAIVHLTSIVDTLATAQDRAYFDLSRLNWEDVRSQAEQRGGRSR